MLRVFSLTLLFLSLTFAGFRVANQSRPVELSSVSISAGSSGSTQNSVSHRFDYNSLKQLIDSKKLKSVDEVIPLLPSNLRDNVTFMFASKSIQKASVQRPRAILFGDDAKTIITFGGDPKLAGFSSLEIMQYIDSASRYEMHEINFNGERAVYATGSETQAKCTTCHGMDPHPIWSGYNTWTGAYGETDDDISQMPTNLGNSFSQFEAFKELKNDPELLPRYKAIFSGHDLAWPYYDGSNSKINQRGLFRMPNDRFAYLASLTRARQLTRVISESTLYKKMAFSFMYVSLCEFYSGKAPLSSRPAEVSQLFPQIRNEMGQRCEVPPVENWQGSRSDWLTANAGYPKDFVNFFGVPYGDSSNELKSGQYGSTSNGIPLGIGSYEETARGLLNNYLLDEMMKHDSVLADIGRRNRVSFPSPKSFKGKDAVVYQASEGFRQEVTRHPYFNGPGVQKASCGYLRQKSLQEMAALARSTQASAEGRGTIGDSRGSNVQMANDKKNLELSPQAVQGRTLLTTSGCISCHDRSGDLQLGPEIDFADAVAFTELNERTKARTGRSLIEVVRDRISKDTSDKRRMPISGRDLTPNEQSALIFYLDSITRKDR